MPLAPSIFDRAVHPRKLGRLLEGERLGHFELEKFVGGGGMGAVFQATDTMLGRTVAVKVLSQDQASEEDTLLRFKNEAQSAARLDHENIARVYYVGEDRGLNYIVFEFIEGENIRDLVDRRGGLPVGEAISYTLQIAEALDHASRRDVVHRDIKPSNVLITAEGQAKLVDMGLARLHQVEHSGDDLTASGVTLGTFDYISPEQARDPRMADVRSDLYSLGCTLYFMLTGKPPFPNGTVLQKLLQHQGDEPPDPRQVRPDLPEEMSQLLSKMLVKSPEARYQRPSELIADLLLLADRLGIRHVVKPGKVWVAEPRSRWAMLRQHVPWMVPTATLLAVVLLMHYLGSSPATQVAAPMNDMPVVLEQIDEGTRHSPTKPQDPAPLVDPANGPAPSDGSAGPTQPDKDPPMPDGVAVSPAQSVASSTHPLRDALTRPKADGASLDVSDGAGASAELDAASAEATSLAEDDHTASVDLSDGAAPSADAPALRTLIVDGTGGVDGRYATLGAAINEALSGDTIELHFDRPAKAEQPLTIDNKELTIRAGSNPQRDGALFRPVIVFRPTQANVSDPGKSHFAMITIRGGKITLEGVHVQMDLDSDVHADTWSMFQIHGAEHVQLADCSLTIRNTPEETLGYHHPNVSFFDVQATSSGASMMPDGMDPNEKIVPIELIQCVARGEAVFLSARKQQPLKLKWTGGFLATTEQLLVAGSGQKKSTSGGYIQVELKHVTALTRRGLYVSTNDRDEPHQLVASFAVSNCILIGDEAERKSLVQQSGIDETVRAFEMRVDWTGRRNVYQAFDFDAFWLIRSGERSGAEELARFSFTDWREKWEKLAVRTPIVWKGPPDPDQPVHSLTAADYEIDVDAPSNPALGAGGEHSGFDPSSLPKLPQTVILPQAGDEATTPDEPPTGDDVAPKASTSSD